MAHVIQELYAAIAVGEDGDEGVIGYRDRAGETWIPLVGSDRGRYESIKALAASVARKQGIKVMMCRFTIREELEELT